MEDMEADAAPIGVIERCCPQVVDIDDYSSQKNQREFYGIILEKPKRDKYRHQKMNAIMDEVPIHVSNPRKDLLGMKGHSFPR